MSLQSLKDITIEGRTGDFKNKTGGGGYSSVAEHLPSICETLGLFPSITKNENK